MEQVIQAVLGDLSCLFFLFFYFLHLSKSARLILNKKNYKSIKISQTKLTAIKVIWKQTE